MKLWGMMAILFAVVFFIIVFRKIRPWTKKILYLAVTLAGTIFAVYLFLFPLDPPLPTTGEYEVVEEEAFFSYVPRDQKMATDGEEREVPVLVYRPARPAKGGYGLVVFSHGSFGVAQSNESLFRELASHGYVVLSLSHPHHSFSAKLSNGKNVRIDGDFFKSVMRSPGAEDPEGTLRAFREWMGVRVDDLNTVLDGVLQGTSDLSPWIDTDRVILSGHSLGASAALAVGRQRSDEILGVIALEGPYVGDITGVEDGKYLFAATEYPLPVLHFYSDALYGKLDAVPLYARNANYLDGANGKFRNRHIAGAGHLGLTDLSLTSPVLTRFLDKKIGGQADTAPAYEILKAINRESLDFLKTLESGRKTPQE